MAKYIKIIRLMAGILCMFMWHGPALACTDLLIQSKEGFLHARSMDFHIPLLASPVSVPRDMLFSSKGSDGNSGLSWKNKYAYAGMASKLIAPDDLLDGLNEHGLSIAALWLSTTQFPEIATGNKAMPSTRLISYLLGTCQNVAEVETALSRIQVWGKPLKHLAQVPAVHLAVADASGEYMVVEFIKGKTNIYRNQSRSLTNDPPMPDMLQQSKSVKPNSGSIRRFCLAAEQSKLIYPSFKNALDSTRVFFKALHIPYKKNKTYTQWVIIKNLQNPGFTVYQNNNSIASINIP